LRLAIAAEGSIISTRYGLLLGLTLITLAAWGVHPASAAPPANDNFAAATVVSVPFSDALNDSEATTEPLEPDPSCAVFDKTVWYSFTPSSNANYAISTAGSNHLNAIGIYTGPSLVALAELDCDDSSQAGTALGLSALAGTTYRIQIGPDVSSGPNPGGNLVVVIDTDPDTDRVPSAIDNCPNNANANQNDVDADGMGDVCDPDDDNDTVPDLSDNCLLVPNPLQEDNDGDGVPGQEGWDFGGDACDNDDDNDLVGDVAEPPCGADAFDGGVRPERTDGVFAGEDEDGDAAIDEALPSGAADADCDGDGYPGQREAGTPLCGNGVNDDFKVDGPVPDDTVIDDGCPGGPPAEGAFSEAQFKIGTNDQDPCGIPGWPSDLVSGGIPESTNRVTIGDLTSYLAPDRKLDKSPGHPSFNQRWDITPGRGVFNAWTNVNDLTSLFAGESGSPPMLGGQRAFGSALGCPWPP
jgi:hypothetical protein